MNGRKIIRSLAWMGMAIIFLLLMPLNGYAQIIVQPGQTVFFVEGDDFDLDISDCSGANVCAAQAIKNEAKLEVQTFFAAGVDETKHAQATLHNWFTLSGDPQLQRVLRANLSGTVSWAGKVLIDVAIGSTKAKIQAKVRLTDLTENRIVAEQKMVDDGCSTNSIEVGCLDYPEGSAAYNLSVDLIRGHQYQFDLVARCESQIDIAAATVWCEFFNDPNDVSRGPVRLNISRDFEEEIDALWAELNALKIRFDNHTHTYLTGKGVGHNNTEATTTLPTSIAPVPSVGGRSGSMSPRMLQMK